MKFKLKQSSQRYDFLYIQNIESIYIYIYTITIFLYMKNNFLIKRRNAIIDLLPSIQVDQTYMITMFFFFRKKEITENPNLAHQPNTW